MRIGKKIKFKQNLSFSKYFAKRKITNVPFFVSNSTLNEDLGIKPVLAKVEYYSTNDFLAD